MTGLNKIDLSKMEEEKIDLSGESESKEIDLSGESESKEIDLSGESESEEIDLSGESESEEIESENDNSKKRKCSEIESDETQLPEKKSKKKTFTGVVTYKPHKYFGLEYPIDISDYFGKIEKGADHFGKGTLKVTLFDEYNMASPVDPREEPKIGASESEFTLKEEFGDDDLSMFNECDPKELLYGLAEWEHIGFLTLIYDFEKCRGEENIFKEHIGHFKYYKSKILEFGFETLNKCPFNDLQLVIKNFNKEAIPNFDSIIKETFNNNAIHIKFDF